MPARGAGFFGSLTDATSFHDELEQVVQLRFFFSSSVKSFSSFPSTV